MTTRRVRRPRRRGQAMVEFALLAPILLVLLTGAAQVAVVVFAQLAADTAAREAARTGADNPLNSQLFAAPVTLDCTGSGDARRACKAAYNSTTSSFGLIDPTKFVVKLSSQQFPSGTTTNACGGTVGTADDGVIVASVSYQAPVFVPFVNRFFADSGNPSVRTVTSTVTMRVSPCAVNGGN